MQKETAMTPESPTTSRVAGAVVDSTKGSWLRSVTRNVGIFLYEMFTVYQHGGKRSVLAA